MTAAITFYGGVGSPTGSNFLLELGGKRILVDCGMRQGSAETHQVNYTDFAYDPSSIDALCVTHAHLDHVGRIPKLVHDGFSGPIYSTAPTRDMAELMFADGLSIMSAEKRRTGQEPLYNEQDITRTLDLWKTVDYHKPLSFDDVTTTYLDAGHILGSAMIQFEYAGKKIVFSGDLGNSPSPLLRETEALVDVDYLVMESVYGDRNHEPIGERRATIERVIRDTIKRKGVLMIPAFSIERTQVLLSEINELVEHEGMPSLPIFLDSPLAIKVTGVYQKYPEYFNELTRKHIASGDDIFDFPRLHFTASVDDSKAITHAPDPKIIIAGSGMSHAGRIRHHEKHYLSDPNNTLLIVGFQAPGTLGRQIEDGEKHVTIFKDTIPVRARIEKIHGYSAHKDSDGLINLVADTQQSLKKVFVVLGEPKSSFFLTQRLRDYLGVDAAVPEAGARVELDL